MTTVTADAPVVEAVDGGGVEVLRIVVLRSVEGPASVSVTEPGSDGVVVLSAPASGLARYVAMMVEDVLGD